ncbi:hypothetical protein [Micromonospora sp. 4G55]|uniref:hypothetical protein n=1 Tax=Micromonospora sp. 4G55 TaxID=2806102 RepID=UPI001A52203E|nr:hypothetical protein [Micromonospora sp. 4G55]MBM0259758.1 hypothetical protein [Micromonospora sp. 4G55]
MGNRELSKDPHRIRTRLRRGTNPKRDLAMLDEVGYKPVSEWDDEELARGRPRNSRGSFSGGPTPKWLTPVVEEERRKRLKQATFDRLMTHSLRAMEVMGELVNDPETPASVRADIARFIYEQQHGKAKSKVDVDATVGPRDALFPAIVLDDGLPQDIRHLRNMLSEEEFRQLTNMPGVVDGQVVDEDDRPKDAVIPAEGVDDEERMLLHLRDGHAEGRVSR